MLPSSDAGFPQALLGTGRGSLAGSRGTRDLRAVSQVGSLGGGKAFQSFDAGNPAAARADRFQAN
jgi:hypothetical protein